MSSDKNKTLVTETRAGATVSAGAPADTSPSIAAATGHHKLSGQQARRGFALGLLSATLAACGGGGSSDSGVADNGGSNPGATPGEEPAYLPEAPMTEKSAARFLGQASLGATDAQIERVMELGYEAWIDEQIATPGNGSRYDWLIEHGYNAGIHEFTLAGSDECLWFKLITSADTLRQRVALALSEIFVINGLAITGTADYRNFGVAAYMDLLEQEAFSSYRQLLEKVTLTHQMGSFLSMRGSKKATPGAGAPDENYAREILQLFSIGLYKLNIDGTVQRDADGQPIETYTNDDIVGLARTFTGWDLNQSAPAPAVWRLPMSAITGDHELGEKRFLGLAIPAGTLGEASLQMALDQIAAHQNVGPFIGRQLIQRLVTSNPSKAYIQRVAEVFNDNGNGGRGDLAAVVKAILLDPEARRTDTSDPAVGKLREPMVRFAQWARSFEARDQNAVRDCKVADLSNPAAQLGQSPLRANSVFNFFRPGFVPPNTALGQSGKVAPELQITNEVTTIAYANFMTEVVSSGVQGMKADYTKELALVDDPVALLARVELLLTAGSLTGETRQLIASTLQALPAKSDEERLVRVHTAVLLVMISPDYLIQK